MGNEVENFIRRKAQRHGANHSRHYRHVVELANSTVDAKPLDARAGFEVDDLHPAPGFGVRIPELLVQREPLEALVARLG